jgi:hypothetical protein
MLEVQGATDTTPPTISAIIDPPPNAAGWHSSDPTVTFDCRDAESGIASCSPPVLISTEGGNQQISGTATDNAGNTATVTETVSLDKNLPSIAILDPTAGQSFSQSPVTVTGTVSDSLSGLSVVACNGSSAAADGGTFTCGAPVFGNEGVIVASAIDAAGNATSIGCAT